MNIKYHKRFEKQFKKLSDKDKKRVLAAIKIMIDNPRNPVLTNHSLKGALSGRRAISAGSDLRMIFEEFGGYALVIFLDLGNHGRVY